MEKIRRAIISVSDKEKIVDFTKELVKLKVEVISTGGTAKLLNDNGLKIIEVQKYTGYPEILSGRVKTLNPRILAGILAIRDNKSHINDMKKNKILPIDLVVVDLYPFERTIAKPKVSLDEIIENIDIGGVTLIRAAAKNYKFVTVICDKNDYNMVLKELKRNNGKISDKTKWSLAKKAFVRTAKYDSIISNYLNSIGKKELEFGDSLIISGSKIQDLRYGENPHQKAAFYSDGNETVYEKLQGKELSFNNILDMNSAYEIILSVSNYFSLPFCVIIKHNNPCGCAIDETLVRAYRRAKQTDSISAFGGIVGVNKTLDAETAREILKIFTEIIIAPDFSSEALEILKSKENLRLVKYKRIEEKLPYDIKKVRSGFLVQSSDTLDFSQLKTVTKHKPSDEEMEELKFAWLIAKNVKSNAIIYTKEKQTIGIGAGQMSRIDSAELAITKAKKSGLEVAGSVMASDAFFPFRDVIDIAAKAKIKAIIQPGGSVKDSEVIQAADEHNIAMVFTGTRHFKH